MFAFLSHVLASSSRLRQRGPARRRAKLTVERLEERFLPASLNQVHLAYVIPSNRTPQAAGVAILQSSLVEGQTWYREQMERAGFGAKTFAFETEADGVTPAVHIVNASETDDFFRAELWSRTIAAAQNAGLSLFSPGHVWLVVCEAHVERADGDIEGGVALGGSFGSGSDGGVAMLGSDGLAMMQTDYLTDDRAYDGLVLRELGRHRLRQDVSFNWFEGATISSVSSSARGAMLHELGHAFGLGHDFRSDSNFVGQLMGNGLRGFRGWAHPAVYPNDDIQLGFAEAAALNSSRYFNVGAVFDEDDKPTLSVATSGDVVPVNGQLEIHFSAADASGLSAALLRRNGDTVAEVLLNGTSAAAVLRTPLYTPGQSDSYQVSVYDVHGNRRDADTSVTPATGFNRAPEPFVKVVPSLAVKNAPVLLDATSSTDADHAAATLTVEWDIDGDGVFDTAPSTTMQFTATYATAGNYLVRARLTDPAGASSVSTPLAVRISDLLVATGSDVGAEPLVQLFDAAGLPRFSFSPYDSSFVGGVRVALADVSGDQIPDLIVAPGAGMTDGALVRVYDGEELLAGAVTELASFHPYGTDYAGAVDVAAGDLNGDHRADIVTGNAPAKGPTVKVFDAADLADGDPVTELGSMQPFGAAYKGGARLAVGDINGDGTADIIAGQSKKGSKVVAISGADFATVLLKKTVTTAVKGGVFVAAGNSDGDNRSDIIIGFGSGAKSNVYVYEDSGDANTKATLLKKSALLFKGGVRVAAADLDGNGRDELVIAAATGLPPYRLRGLDGGKLALLDAYFSEASDFTEARFVAASRIG